MLSVSFLVSSLSYKVVMMLQGACPVLRLLSQVAHLPQAPRTAQHLLR